MSVNIIINTCTLYLSVRTDELGLVLSDKIINSLLLKFYRVTLSYGDKIYFN